MVICWLQVQTKPLDGWMKVFCHFGTNKCSNSQEASTAMMTQYPVIGSSAFYQLSILSGLRSFTVDELSNHFTRCYQKSLASFELRRTYYNRNKCEFQYMYALATSPLHSHNSATSASIISLSGQSNIFHVAMENTAIYLKRQNVNGSIYTSFASSHLHSLRCMCHLCPPPHLPKHHTK